MKRWLTWPKLLFYALLLLFAAVYYVPKISAARYREPIRAGLENALGRKVEIGEVMFQLLPLPGFTVTEVKIGEDPAIGPEPIAYIKTLRGRPRFSALFGGPLEFASMDLEDASVNLTRVEMPDADDHAVRWNFSPLLRTKLLTAFPSVHMLDGRVNFKFGDTKSVFYLLHTDVDLWPPSKGDDPWTLRVNAEPARTDRPARGFGSFVARGEWQAEKSLVTLDVKLEKSELGDMVTLFRGQESDLHGHIWGDAHLAGPLNRVGLAGRLMLDDIHGWNQTPPGGSAWPVSLGGAIDIPGQAIDIRATTGGIQPPLDVRYRVTNYLARPRWGVTALFSQLPMAPLVGMARNLGLDIPSDMTFSGMAQGAVGYSMPEGKPRMDGQVNVASATLAVAGTPPLHLLTADLQFAGSSVTLAPALIANDAGESATVAGNFDMESRKLDVTLSSEGMALASLRRQMSVARVPVLGLATSGVWSGELHFSSLPEASWTGDILLRDADIPFNGFAQPVHIVLAEATINGASLATKRLSFVAGGVEGQGEYRYELGAPHPHRFRLNLGRTDAVALEKLLIPALHRGSFLSALSFGKIPEPDWLRTMHSDGTVQIAALDLGGTVLTRLRARVVWDGDQVRFTGLQGNMQDMAMNGTATVSLAQRQPRYDIAGTAAGLLWRSGRLSAEGTVTTSGTGLELLSNLKAEGKFRGRNLDLSPVAAAEGNAVWDNIEGSFEWVWNARNPRLKLGELMMTSAGNTYQGSAETQSDGQVLLKATDGTRQIQASGALLKGEALKPVAP
jgi:hypothetical protein